jgi:hypothetical protein
MTAISRRLAPSLRASQIALLRSVMDAAFSRFLVAGVMLSV